MVYKKPQPGQVVYTQSAGSRPESDEVPHLDDRAPTVSDIRTSNNQVFPIGKTWHNVQGETRYYLNNFFYTNGQMQANWIQFQTTPSGPGLLSITTSDSAVLDGSADAQNVNVTGAVVANATNPTPVYTTGDAATETAAINVQVATTVTPTPADTSNVGLVCLNENHFTIDPTSGMVSLIGGGLAIDQIAVDDNTAPGTDPVVADGSGEITVSGAVVANHDVPIETHSRAANAYNIEVQVAKAVTGAPGVKTGTGTSVYDDVLFLVDGDGYVETATTTDASLIIGNAARGTGKIGQLVSSDNSVNINYNDPNIDLSTAGSTEQYANLGFSLSGGTFTVHSANGTALSSSNGFVRLQSTTRAQNQLFTLNQNFRFIDSSGSSNIIGNTFGKQAGDVWDEDMPFYLYAVRNTAGNDAWLAISRIPFMRKTRAVGLLGSAASATADDERSHFFLQRFNGATWDDPTLADYAEQPCIVIGCFRMQSDASDDWTVQTINEVDGVGNFFQGSTFALPEGLFGATTYFSSASGTPPSVVNRSFGYTLFPSTNYVSCRFSASNFTNGTGAVNTRINIPFKFPGTTNDCLGFGYYQGADTNSLIFQGNANDVNYCVANFVNPTAAGILLNTSWGTNSSYQISGTLYYLIQDND